MINDAKQKLTAKRSRNWIKVGMSTCGIAAGAEQVFQTLQEEIAKRKLDITVSKCGCIGMCYAEPLVEVAVDGLPQVTYGNITPKDAVAIIERHIYTKQLLQDHIFKVA